MRRRDLNSVGPGWPGTGQVADARPANPICAPARLDCIMSRPPDGVPFSNRYGYDDPAMNDLIDRAAVELDRAKRIDLYKQFQQRASDRLPLIVAAEFTFITVASRRLHNIATNPRWATSSWADTWLEG